MWWWWGGGTGLGRGCAKGGRAEHVDALHHLRWQSEQALDQLAAYLLRRVLPALFVLHFVCFACTAQNQKPGFYAIFFPAFFLAIQLLVLCEQKNYIEEGIGGVRLTFSPRP